MAKIFVEHLEALDPLVTFAEGVEGEGEVALRAGFVVVFEVSYFDLGLGEVDGEGQADFLFSTEAKVLVAEA
jgi:hypothetical protein